MKGGFISGLFYYDALVFIKVDLMTWHVSGYCQRSCFIKCSLLTDFSRLCFQLLMRYSCPLLSSHESIFHPGITVFGMSEGEEELQLGIGIAGKLWNSISSGEKRERSNIAHFLAPLHLLACGTFQQMAVYAKSKSLLHCLDSICNSKEAKT